MRVVRLHIQSIANNSISSRKDFSFLLKNICLNVALYNNRIETLISIPEVSYVFLKIENSRRFTLEYKRPTLSKESVKCMAMED